MTPKALLFDMDGTLVDSDPLHIAVFIDLLRDYGITLTEADYMARIHGRMNVEIFADLLPNEDPHKLDLEKEAAYRARLGDRVDPLPGTRHLISRAKTSGVKIAAVTNGPRTNLDAILQATGLAESFDVSVSSNDVENGKPDPEPYARALAQLGIKAEDSIAFEDSPSGIRSATAAGIATIGITSSLDAETLIQSGAIAAIQDFTDPILTRHLGEYA